MVRMALVVGSVLLLLVAVLWGYQRQLIYLPDTTAPTSVGAKDVVLETSDGLRLGAWLVPPRGVDRGKVRDRPGGSS